MENKITWESSAFILLLKSLKVFFLTIDYKKKLNFKLLKEKSIIVLIES